MLCGTVLYDTIVMLHMLIFMFSAGLHLIRPTAYIPIGADIHVCLMKRLFFSLTCESSFAFGQYAKTHIFEEARNGTMSILSELTKAGSDSASGPKVV